MTPRDQKRFLGIVSVRRTYYCTDKALHAHVIKISNMRTVAAASKLSHSTICNWLRGAAGLSHEKYVRLRDQLKLMGVDCDEVINADIPQISEQLKALRLGKKGKVASNENRDSV